MMIKTILVAADGTTDSNRCLKMAFRVAQRLESHVKVLHVRSDPKDTLPLLGEGMSVALIEDMMDIAEKDAAQCRIGHLDQSQSECRHFRDRAPCAGGTPHGMCRNR